MIKNKFGGATMWPETRREREALDRHITGNYNQ